MKTVPAAQGAGEEGGGGAVPKPLGEVEYKFAQPLVETMPDMADRLKSIEEFIGEKKWDNLFAALSEMQLEAGGAVWSLDGKVYVPVSDFVRGKIVSLPADGLAFYRLRNDAEARALFDQGVAEQDAGVLDVVMTKYPGASCAVAALDSAGDFLMDRGDFVSATLRFQRLLSFLAQCPQSGDGTRFRAMVLSKLAFCMAKLGDRCGVTAVLDQLKGLAVEVPVAGGGTDFAAFVRSELDGARAAAADTVGSAWPGALGYPCHSRPMRDIGSNLSKRWGTDIDWEVKKPRYHGRYYDRLIFDYGEESDSPTPPVPLPALDENGAIYVATPTVLVSLDTVTGRQRWATGPSDPPVSWPRAGVAAAAGENPFMLAGWYRWQGTTSVSVGGGKVFRTEVLGAANQARIALSAFDAAMGKRLWSFQRDFSPVAFESHVYFPWAPSYVELPGSGGERGRGVVVGLTTYADQMFLHSLDADTGEVNWKVFLSAAHRRRPSFLGMMPFIPNMGQAVTIEGYTAYVATGAGTVAAVDVRDGKLLWISKYNRSALDIDVKGQQVSYSYKRGWRIGVPVVLGGTLYVAPWDSASLIAFDRGTGTVVKEIPRGTFTHFVGCHRGDLIFVGPETGAMDPKTGLLRWVVPTPFEPTGLPVLTQSSLLIPARGQLCVITLDGAAQRKTYDMPGADPRLPLGNVISCDGRLFAVNGPQVSCFSSFEDTYTSLAGQIEQHPELAKPLVERGNLCFMHGKYANALSDLRAAEAAMAADSAAGPELVSRFKRTMFETLLKLSEAEAEKGLEHLDAAGKYAATDADRARLCLARGAALAAAGRHADAVDEYVSVVEKMGSLKVEAGELVAAGVLAQARLGELVARHGGKVYARVDAKLKPQFERLIRAEDVAGLQQMQGSHPHSSLADNCLLEAARILDKDQGSILRAQAVLRSMIELYGRSEVLGEAYSMLLSDCFRSSHYRLAVAVLNEIRDKHPAVRIPWDGKELAGTELADRLMQGQEVKIAIGSLTRELLPIVPPLRAAWTSGSGSEVVAAVVSEENCFARGIGLAVDVEVTSQRPTQYSGAFRTLRAFDIASGKTIWTADAGGIEWSVGEIERNNSPWTRGRCQAIALCSDHVVALGHPGGIEAFELSSGKRLWEKKWARPAGSQPTAWLGNGMAQVDKQFQAMVNPRPVFAARAGRIFYCLPDGTLGCVGAATGEQVWETKHKGFPNGAIGLFGNAVVVVGVQPNTITAYGVSDGKVFRVLNLASLSGSPAYDEAENRIVVGDGKNLLCYDVADFGLLWQGQAPDLDVNYSQPWCAEVLPDSAIAFAGYAAGQHSRAYVIALYEGATGRRIWASTVEESRNDENGYFKTDLLAQPLVGKDFVFVHVRFENWILVGGQLAHEKGVIVHVFDRRTGRELRSSVVVSDPSKSNQEPWFLSAAGAAGHSLVVRGWPSPELLGKLVVVGGSGEVNHEYGLASGKMGGGYAYPLMQRWTVPVVTAGGSILVPTGVGITCFESDDRHGSGPERPAPEVRRNEK